MGRTTISRTSTVLLQPHLREHSPTPVFLVDVMDLRALSALAVSKTFPHAPIVLPLYPSRKLPSGRASTLTT